VSATTDTLCKLILPSGEVRDVRPENGRTFSMIELQKIIGGDIDIQWSEDDLYVAVLNEHMYGLDLDPNPAGTEQFKKLCPNVVLLKEGICGPILIGPAEVIV